MRSEEILEMWILSQSILFDAKDFDDAISFKELENGNLEVGVHIADVSHYVVPETIIDDEAINRGTSVYLVDRVVPMLPEVFIKSSLLSATSRRKTNLFGSI